jgi:hypothetical protein
MNKFAAKHQKTSEDREGDEDNRTESERVTAQGDMNCDSILQQCFMQEDSEGSPLCLRWVCSVADN